MNPYDLCYQCSKHGPDCLSGLLRIKVFIDEPHFTERIKLLSNQIQMNTLFKNNYEIKRRICDKNIHKAMKIPVDIHPKKGSLSQFNQKMHLN